MRNGRPLIEDPLFAARVAQVEIDLMALEVTNLRVLSAERSRRDPGAVSSILKVKGSEIQQTLSELLLHAVGPGGIPDVRGETSLQGIMSPAHAMQLAAGYFNLRKTTIYGGANEIQRNIIAHHILGL